jgi:hypothetical protein
MTTTDPDWREKVRNRPRRVGKRPPRTPEEATAFAAWAVHRVCLGQLTVEEAKAIQMLLNEFRKLHEQAALLKRIADLEMRLQLQPTHE